MAYPCVCPEAYKSNQPRKVNKTFWESVSQLNGREVVSALSARKFPVPALSCELEDSLPWTHALESFIPLFSGHAQKAHLSGAHALPSRSCSKYPSIPFPVILSPLPCPALISSLDVTEQLEYPPYGCRGTSSC
jgi:hypothetical protein